VLTPEELKVCTDLGDIWNAFLKLKLQTADREDFMFHIHALQSIVL
jgi:hypothetical protein